jgi:hypothetical protein
MEPESRSTTPAPASVVAAPESGDVTALLEAVAPSGPIPPAPVLATLAGWDEAGRPLVAFGDEPTPALATVPLSLEDLGREVVVLFLEGDERRPLVVGLVQPPGPASPAPVPGSVEASVDGERLEFKAGREIVFRCGNASITLTRAGKVLIQGAYLLSRSTGVNRIKGGSVQIN